MFFYRPEGILIDTPENKAAIRNVSALREACRQERILEARVVLCDHMHDLWVDLGEIKGIIPREECALGIDDGSVKDIAIISRVGKAVCFVITGFNENSDGSLTAVCSRKIVQAKCLEEYISLLEPGEIIAARVTHLESFGCFADIGCGNIALIPIDAISVSRISHPRDRFKSGQDIKAVVKSVTPEGRVSLTHKELLGTWEDNAKIFAPGQTVPGIIRSVESYGIFVELTPNLAGLAELREEVYPGQQASVYIKSLIPEKMKIKLIIVDAFDDVNVTPKSSYFIDDGKIDRWVYSPPESARVVETVF